MPWLWAGFGSVFALSPVWAWFFLWLVGLFVGSGLMFGGLLCFGFWVLLLLGEDIYHIPYGFVGLFNR